MSASKASLSAVLTFLCLTMFCTQCCVAQGWTKNPTTWWPDPSTGLMWTGQIHGNPHPDLKRAFSNATFSDTALGQNGLNWQQANDYCASLQLGGFAGWRLPTLDEVKAATKTTQVNEGDYCPAAFGPGPCRGHDLIHPGPYNELRFKGGINTYSPKPMMIWTSTLSQTDSRSAWVVAFDSATTEFLIQMVDPYMGGICVRSMAPDLLQAAKAAEVYPPVPDLQTLQTFIPLNKARLAYQAGNYQESIGQAQIAISLKADPATAYWGSGISYGRLGQWDQAISNLQSALKIDKNYGDAETALKWAKDGLKAAKKGKQPKEPSPKWN
jgi:tetratricopeptide (TPR) repeat protein